jgi:regulator of sirC expression with transglutaminase-like and TPR domain
MNLALTLKQDLGCDYSKELVTSGVMADIRSTRFFRDSSDLFLHGFTEKRRGSCASLPVLMVAVSRRCGYPLHLVTCKGHLFCRWEEGQEVFNIEAAIEGVDSKPDSYYHDWPHPCTEAELKTEKYLKTLTPDEELGVFAQLRAACLEENQRFPEAAQAYSVALHSFPDSKFLKAYLNNVKGKD